MPGLRRGRPVERRARGTHAAPRVGMGCPAPDPCESARRRRDERGAALVITMMVAAITCCLGLAYLLMGETESLRAKAWTEHAKSRAVATDVVALATSWLTQPSPDAAVLPLPSE